MAQNVALMEFESNPNIGLFFFVNDKFAILGREVDSKKKKEIENVLNVPIYQTTILGTDLIGVFVTGNNDFIITPELYEYEQKILEDICKKHEVELISLKEKLNTFGNNLCVGNDIIVANSIFPKPFLEILEKKTKLKTFKLENRDFSSAGAVCKFLKNKFYVSQELEEDQLKPILEKVAGVGTVNAGAPFVSSGIVGNKNGVLLGSMCSSIEIQNIVEGLDYI